MKFFAYRRRISLYRIFTINLTFYMVIVLFWVVLLECPAAWAALEKSSKKECAMCHVMWLNVFRTEQETLIDWEPGNVLMKDTQGIVSAEEICYSCHDGYVLDSRHIAWKGNNHTTFKKLPENAKIPEPFTLSNTDEIYCGTCHTPHSEEAAAPEGDPDASVAGPNSFLRVSNTDSAMCEACHVNAADYKRTNGHPVHTDKLRIPDTLFETGSIPAEKKDSVICQTCHAVHGAKGRNLTVMDNRGSALCMVCHEQRSVTGTLHDLRLTMPEEINIKGERMSESGPCGACHVPHNAAGYKLWARKMPPGNPASGICLSCHKENTAADPGKENKAEIKGIGQYSHPNDVDIVSKSVLELAPTAITDKLPLYAKNGARQTEGTAKTVQCFTCHNMHQWDPVSPENKGGKDAIGDASTSFLRISAGLASMLCLECHRDKRQLLSYDHNLAVTAPEAENIQGRTAAVSGPCGACHIAHNAADKKLWARDPAPDSNDPADVSALQYCIGCHGENKMAKEKPVGENDHPVNVVSRGPQIPPADRVASMLPLYNEKGSTENGDRILCRTCHNPHIWTVGDEVISASGERKNIEGDARNSFLRKVASPAPDLCVVCHEDTALLTGTDHDLFVTAPSAKNQQNRNVTESGQCGVCHAVHNSPEKRLLWVGPYGPVAEDQHSMNGLCTGCHSKEGIAGDKIPPVAMHPPGQLISNIMWADTPFFGYIKLFDADWQEVNSGDLSCSSCHSFNQWNHRLAEQGPGENIEGNADTSFLRTSSDQAVCIDCHGQRAIWRYTYYHSLEKREMLKGLRPR